jgi:hypothetical protein
VRTRARGGVGRAAVERIPRRLRREGVAIRLSLERTERRWRERVERIRGRGRVRRGERGRDGARLAEVQRTGAVQGERFDVALEVGVRAREEEAAAASNQS